MRSKRQAVIRIVGEAVARFFCREMKRIHILLDSQGVEPGSEEIPEALRAELQPRVLPGGESC